jgi:hypothetical protein
VLERARQLVDIPTRQAAALVLHLDEHALGACANPECDGGPSPRELEGVLQNVSEARRLATHHFALDDIMQAYDTFEHAAREGALKSSSITMRVVTTPDDHETIARDL